MTALETTSMIIGVLVSIGTALTLAGAGVRWLVKHYLSELKPNSGSSLKDKVNMLEARMNEADQMRRNMDKKLDRLYDLLISYISNKTDDFR